MFSWFCMFQNPIFLRGNGRGAHSLCDRLAMEGNRPRAGSDCQTVSYLAMTHVGAVCSPKRLFLRMRSLYNNGLAEPP